MGGVVLPYSKENLRIYVKGSREEAVGRQQCRLKIK